MFGDSKISVAAGYERSCCAETQSFVWGQEGNNLLACCFSSLAGWCTALKQIWHRKKVPACRRWNDTCWAGWFQAESCREWGSVPRGWRRTSWKQVALLGLCLALCVQGSSTGSWAVACWASHTRVYWWLFCAALVLNVSALQCQQWVALAGRPLHCVAWEQATTLAMP